MLPAKLGFASVLLVIFGLLAGCPADDTWPPGVVPPTEAYYVGSSACSACHANIAALHFQTGHSQALKPVLSGRPDYPGSAPGVPAPPAGYAWTDIAYAIGGYKLPAQFVDTQGFLLTGAGAQYNVPIPAIRLEAGFVPFRASEAGPVPFEYDDFHRLTTGAVSLIDSGGERKDNRPGINGLWAEAGVQCEACHGPGSLHVPNPSAGNIVLDAGSTLCASCHSHDPESPQIAASGGLIEGFQQSAELAASPHAGFSCTFCHNPHASAEFDPANAIRNGCQACHPNVDMALHAGAVFVQGDYVEPVTCASCHMPYAVKTRADKTIQLTNGETTLLGDTQSHVFRLDPSDTSLNDMFADGGTVVARDAAGRASVSTCFVCQRCHNGLGNAFAFPPNQGCAFGEDIHVRTDQAGASVAP